MDLQILTVKKCLQRAALIISTMFCNLELRAMNASAIALSAENRAYSLPEAIKLFQDTYFEQAVHAFIYCSKSAEDLQDRAVAHEYLAEMYSHGVGAPVNKALAAKHRLMRDRIVRVLETGTEEELGNSLLDEVPDEAAVPVAAPLRNNPARVPMVRLQPLPARNDRPLDPATNVMVGAGATLGIIGVLATLGTIVEHFYDHTEEAKQKKMDAIKQWRERLAAERKKLEEGNISEEENDFLQAAIAAVDRRTEQQEALQRKNEEFRIKTEKLKAQRMALEEAANKK